ncbi:nucleotide disphospho-sugar-binding domain-containing protein [Pseudarthrobacter sulfonivorans]|uniref:glycosyltransferase n=1 Tax=Pseudarthrobacter sulfonivorans TaxID=121292 RepID=UPI0028651DEF|nr:nucleotide disphospho-sugar-binding domain-containing protein [Pseudarthrobacter sulfonivorans]MDR6417340.1 MGT family glycosyltransferase [Pseudarthrobacter sulfonivorans]
MNILFASQAIDGHFNPMTGVAMRLKERGHDVRWYTGPVFAAKLQSFGIPLFPFRRAIEHRADDLNELYPERARLKGPRAIGFDGEKIFASNVTNFFEDIRELDQDFPVDVVVADSSMFIHRLASHVMGKPVVSFVAIPNMESDQQVPPLFFGFRPPRNPAEKALQGLAGLLSDKVILRPASQSYRRQHATYGQPVPGGGRLTDEPYRCSDATIQTGTEPLDFPRRRVNPKVHYVGALLPHRGPDQQAAGGGDGGEFPRSYPSTLVITQGTVDNVDQNKLIVPALEAVKDLDALVIVATGGRGTEALKARYPQPNVVVRDYVDFAKVFDFTDVFITNGGFGGVQLSLSKGVPLVVAGINEGKSDVNARVEHAGVGINLRSESPKPANIAKAVGKVLADPGWKSRAGRMQEQFNGADPAAAAAAVVEAVVRRTPG